MRFKEYGQKKNPAVVLIHPEFTRWNFFEKVIPVLAENYFVIVPVLPGYDEKRPKSVFVSVEKTASDVEKWIVFDDIDMVECIYGCSLGGAVAARIAVNGKIKVKHVILDGAPAPNALPAPAAGASALANWLKLRVRKKTDISGFSFETVFHTLYSLKSYSLPEKPADASVRIEYWYGSREREERQTDIAGMKKKFPQLGVREKAGAGHGRYLLKEPDEFCSDIDRFIHDVKTEEEKAAEPVRMQERHHGGGEKRKKLLRRFFIPAGVFAVMLFYLECLLRLTNRNIPFWGLGLFRCLVSSVATGLLIWLVTSLIPRRWIAAVVAAVMLFWVGFFVVAEACVMDHFGTYYQVSYMAGMSSQVAGDFGSDMGQVVLSHFWMIPLAAAPCVLTLVFQKRLIPEIKAFRNPGTWVFQGAAVVVLFLLNTAVCLAGDSSYYEDNYSANSAIPQSGILNSLRLEAKYGIFGDPSGNLGTDETYIAGAENDPSADGNAGSGASSSSADASQQPAATPEPTAAPVEYGDNVLDIDFDSLIASDTDETLLSMDQYFASQKPTKKNEYTGLFEGKNLIMITAEAFSYAVIDEERTPALYELANNGFVMTNYYQPDWTQSTTGGEFAHMTGIIPTWVNGGTAFSESADNAMPFAPGWMFRAEGYTTKAYHNNTYHYYGRDETHPNLGYDYVGIGNGLDIPSAADGWPASDLEMFQATIGEDIENYVQNGVPFHTYYMSVSGHADYGWGENSMSDKNRSYIESLNLDYSEPVLAYLAAQQELEYGLEYLLEALEEAGIADDTVIVMTADHYPYGLTQNVDYYQELIGENTNVNMTSYYKNSLIIWSGSMDEPVEVDTPCTAVDAIPTIYNLFGLDYDSRLLSGRDILSGDVEIGNVDSNMNAAIFVYSGSGRSWVTAAGSYEAYTGEFIPAEGVALEDESAYVSTVANLMENRDAYAQSIIATDYYRHVFPAWTGGMKVTDAIGGSN